MPNSSMLVLPISTAPALRSLSTTVALYGGMKVSNIFEAHVVGIPSVQKLSLIAMGKPSSSRGLPTKG